MFRSVFAFAACFGVLVLPAHAQAQMGRTTMGGRSSVSGLGGAGTNTSGLRTQGMEQSGQLESNAALSRDANSFVGSSNGNFLSRAGAQGGGMRGQGSVGSMGGMQGMNTLGTMGTMGTMRSMGAMGAMGTMGMMGGMYGRTGMAGRGGFGMNQFNQMNAGNRAGAGAGTRQIRTPMQLGFEVQPLAASEVSATLERRVTRIPGLESVSGVAVRMDGRTAVLQGVVASQTQRDLVARLALLEPGISDVRNELVVNPSGALPAGTAVPAPVRIP